MPASITYIQTSHLQLPSFLGISYLYSCKATKKESSTIININRNLVSNLLNKFFTSTNYQFVIDKSLRNLFID